MLSKVWLVDATNTDRTGFRIPSFMAMNLVASWRGPGQHNIFLLPLSLSVCVYDGQHRSEVLTIGYLMGLTTPLCQKSKDSGTGAVVPQ